MTMATPRPEYPRPQWARERWQTLNGTWRFLRDPGRSGRDRGLPGTEPLHHGEIHVPFCPESALSGIGVTDFLPCIWYQRHFSVPEKWAGERILLHFGAVDYDAEVWVNGTSVGTHRGGFSPFTLEITDALQTGANILTVCAEDDVRSPLQPGGKQSPWYASRGCHYTRTTGIWQTVWLEPVPRTYLGRPRITPDLENGCFHVEAPVQGDVKRNLTVRVVASLDGAPMGEASARVSAGTARLTVPVAEVRPWGPGSPTLYDLAVSLHDGDAELDRGQSYGGLRSLGWDGPALLLNGMPVFQRLILDQGFYPDGIFTAPSDDELRRDIERAQAMGFNGARLHQKVFEERFLYWADKLGYLVWGEMASWGLDLANPAALERFQTEWLQILGRDYSHPSIVGWCPFNETNRAQNPEVLRQIYRVTKALDATRPVIDASGYVHVETDIYDVHDYDQNPETFAARYAETLPLSGEIYEHCKGYADIAIAGRPYFISEYGGIWWNPGQVDDKAWGYGNRPRSEEEFLARLRGLTDVLLDHPGMCAFCYTQLTDVEQEVNGLYTYDRHPKFDPETIKAIIGRKAAVEA
jgi:beta-galactosidase/beta-glucuronidase